MQLVCCNQVKAAGTTIGYNIVKCGEHYSDAFCLLEKIDTIKLSIILKVNLTLASTHLHEYYPNNSNSSWYIKFSAKVEGEDIVSACEIWTRKEGYLVEVTALKSPYRYSVSVAHVYTSVICAAKITAEGLRLSPFLPTTADDIAEALWNMAESLIKKTKQT